MSDLFFNIQPSLMMNSPVMGPNLGAQGLGDSALGEGQFQDLLSTVSDLEVADSQLTGLNEANKEMLDAFDLNLPKAGKDFSDTNSVLAQQLLVQGQGASSTPANAVGQKMAEGMRTPLLSETPQGVDLRLQSLDQLGEQSLQSLKNADASANIKPESVAAWTTAFASGDLKSVKVETTNPMQPAAHPSANESAYSELRADLGNKVQAGGDVMGHVAHPKHAAVNGAQNTTDFLSKHTAGAGSVATLLEQAPQAVSEKPSSFHSDTNSKSSKSAKDFMLENAYVQGGASAVMLKDSPVFVASDSVGAPGDKRISSEAINFMADKIDSLKAQGGGQLKLELGNGDIGAVQIQVSVTGGRLNVKMMADRQETLNALQASKADLMQKLADIAPANLTVGGSGSAGNSSTSFAAQMKSSVSMENSSELLSLRDVSNSKRAQNLQGNTVADKSAQDLGARYSMESNADFGESLSQDDKGSFKQENFGRGESSNRDRGENSGFQREERRQQAREQWRDLQERRSA